MAGLLSRLKTARWNAHYVRKIWKCLDGVYPRECNICGYAGMFKARGLPPRFDARCPSCNSLERHRHQALWIKRNEDALRNKRILHFAPEPILGKVYGSMATTYASADIAAGRADLVLNIEKIEQPDGSWDIIVANHVLEHVDEKRALAEIHRVLAPGGLAVLSFPIALGFEHTYENPAIISKADRDLHFGQWNHVRFYGVDAAHRIAQAGFEVSTFLAGEPYDHRHSLGRDSCDFLARRL